LATPLPLVSEVEGFVFDYWTWKARAEEDGIVTAEELLAVLPTIEAMLPLITVLILTLAHLSACVRGAKGLFSDRARRSWSEAHARYADVLPDSA
jgi:hypothetical protein